jgi:hypothetical protein
MAQKIIVCNGYQITLGEDDTVIRFTPQIQHGIIISLRSFSSNCTRFAIKILLDIFHNPMGIPELFEFLYKRDKDYLLLFPEDSSKKNEGTGILNDNITSPYINKLFLLKEEIQKLVSIEEFNFEILSNEFFILYFAHLCENKSFPAEIIDKLHIFTDRELISEKINNIISEDYSFISSKKQIIKFLPAIFLQLFLISCKDINKYFSSFLKKVFIYRCFIKYNDPRFFCTNKIWRLSDLISDEKSSMSFRKYLLRKEVTRKYIMDKLQFKNKIKEFFPSKKDLNTRDFDEYISTQNIRFSDDCILQIQNSLKDFMRREETDIKQKINKMVFQHGGWEAAYCAFEISRCSQNYNEWFSYYCLHDEEMINLIRRVNLDCITNDQLKFRTSPGLDHLQSLLRPDPIREEFRNHELRQFHDYLVSRTLNSLDDIRLPNGAPLNAFYRGDKSELVDIINLMKSRFQELMRITQPILLPKERVSIKECPICLDNKELVSIMCHPNHSICSECYDRSYRMNLKYKHVGYICVICRAKTTKK